MFQGSCFMTGSFKMGAAPMARKKKINDYGTGIPYHEVEAIARVLLPEIQAFFESEGATRIRRVEGKAGGRTAETGMTKAGTSATMLPPLLHPSFCFARRYNSINDCYNSNNPKDKNEPTTTKQYF